MRQAPARWTGGLALSGLLALGGCVDMFTEGPLVAAPRWTGTTTAGPATIPECAPMKVDVAIYENEWILGPYALDFLAIDARFALGRHAGTVTHHDVTFGMMRAPIALP